MNDYYDEVKIECMQVWRNSKVDRIYPLKSGYGHLCYVIEVAQEKYLLKINLRHTNTEDIDNELYGYEILAKHVSVPEIVRRGVLPKVEKNYFIQRWIEGIDAKHKVNELLDEKKKDFFYSFGEMTGQMHKIKSNQFSEDLLGYRPFSSVAEFCENRVKHSIETIRKNELLPKSSLSLVENKLKNKWYVLNNIDTPSFVHGDLHLGNVLWNDGHIVGIIDFESCKFLDSLYDFVKLKLWVFDEYSQYYSDFLEGYSNTNKLPDDMDERLDIYMGVEYLYFIEYFGHKYYQEDMLTRYQNKIKQWSEEV